jgi:serine/threonine protein kinase
MVMELCTGGSLADIINSRVPANLGGLPETQIKEIMWQVCTAVSKLHSLSPPVVHRDIKAENILIGQDGMTYKLCDFGSCQEGSLIPDSDRARNTIQEQIERFTTLAYRSPEMLDLWMEKPIDTKADVWALGCLLYKCCYLLLPFEDGTSRLAILNAKLEFPAAQSAAYSAPLLQLIKTILQPDPELRPDIWAVLQQLAAWRGVSAPTPTHSRTPSSSSRTPAATPTKAAPQPQTHTAHAFVNALDWESTSGDTVSAPSTPAKAHAASSAAPVVNVMDDDFFGSMPSHNAPTTAASSDSPSSFVFDFDQSPAAVLPTSGSMGEAAWASFDEPFAPTSEPITKREHLVSSGSMAPPQQPSDHLSSSGNHLNPRRPSAGSASLHRRSVSDSHAVFDGEPYGQRHGHRGHHHHHHQHQHSAMSPQAHFMALLRQETSTSARLLLNAVSMQVQGSDPCFLTLRQWIVLSWARFGGEVPSGLTIGTAGANPEVAQMIFDSIQSELSTNVSMASASALIWLRFAQESSPAFLQLLLARKSQFDSLLQSAPENSWQLQVWRCLNAKLELHLAVPEIEGSLSFDVYFRTLRDQQMKLKIGGSASPLRRQTCQLLIQLAECLSVAIDTVFRVSQQQPSSDWLEFVLSSLLSEEWACMLVLQYLLVKLLATKADLGSEITAYQTIFGRLYTHLTRTKMACSSLQAVLPQLPAVPPAIDRGTVTQIPPSLHPCFASNVSILPHHLIPDHVSILQDPSLLALFKQIALESTGQAQETPPFFGSAAAAQEAPTQSPPIVNANPLSQSQTFDPFSAHSRPATPTFDPFNSDPWGPIPGSPQSSNAPAQTSEQQVAQPAPVQLLVPPPSGGRRPSSSTHRRVASSGAAFIRTDEPSPALSVQSSTPVLDKKELRRSQPRESPKPEPPKHAVMTSEQKLSNTKQVAEMQAELKAVQTSDPANMVCADCGGTILFIFRLYISVF